MTNKNIHDAVFHMRSTQRKINDDQNILLSTVKANVENNQETTFDNLESTLLNYIENNIEEAKKFNSIIAPQHKNMTGYYSITTNKIVETLELAKEVLDTQDDMVSSLLKGKLPCNFKNSITSGQLPVLGQKGAFWGTSKPTIINALLDITLTSMEADRDYYAKSSIFYQFPLLDTVKIDDYSGFHYLTQDSRGSWSLTIPHCGYSFGGARTDIVNIYKPHDCTSFLESIYQLPANSASTVDLFFTHRVLSNNEHKSITDQWKTSTGEDLVKLFDITEQPQIGDIVAARTFSPDQDRNSSFGSGGHAGIFVTMDNNDAMTTLAYNRDMRKVDTSFDDYGMEGFGIETRQTAENKETFYLARKVNDSNDEKDYLFTSFEDLVSRADQKYDEELETIGDQD